jgi:hypothetical protein
MSISGAEQPDLVKLSGTTTFAKEAITALAARHGAERGGYLEMGATLQREPDNQADPNAVAVYAEGDRIGYLPGYVASLVDLSAEGARPVHVQIFTEVLQEGLRAEGWAWLAKGPPEWEWSLDNRPPMSSQAKAEAQQDAVTEMVADALGGGGARAKEFRAGLVEGVHYLQLIEPIKQLKREERLDEALTLCYAAITGAEAAREGREPAPWYTEQAAIIHRKLGQKNQEIKVLERWLKVCPPDRRDGSSIAARLGKLQASDK